MINIIEQIKLLKSKILPVNGKESSLRVQLLKSSGGVFFLKVNSMFSQFVITLLLAHLLGAEGYGSFAFVMAVVTLVSTPATLGLPMLLVRQIAAYSVRSEWGLIRGLLRRANAVVFALSTSVAILCVFFFWEFGVVKNQTTLSVLMIAVVMIPVMSLNALRGAALRGLNKVVLGFLPESLIQHWVFIVLIGTIYFLMGSTFLDPQLSMMLQVAATITAFLVGTGLLIRHLPREIKYAAPLYDSKAWINSAGSFLLIGGLQIVNHEVDLVMVGAMLGDRFAGVYRVATRCAEVIPVVLHAVNTALGPTISKLYVAGEKAKLQKIATKSARVILLCSLPIVLTFVFFGSWVLSTIFGMEFRTGGTALAILSCGQLVNIGTGSVSLLLNMTRHENVTAKITGWATILNIVLNASFIPVFGIEGAALSTAISISVSNILLAVQVKRKLNVDATAFGRTN